MMTDPISDMLTRIRNAALARKRTLDLPHSRVKFAIAKILEKEGYLEHVEIPETALKPTLRLTLKYTPEQKSAITSIRRVSKPGQRIYKKVDDLKRVRSGYGLAIISTPNGLMTSSEAKKRRLGGEIICEVF